MTLSLEGSNFQAISDVSPVILAAGEGEQKIPTFKMTAYTGKPVVKFGERVVIETSGIKFDRSEIPIRMEHMAEKGVGHADKVWVENHQLYASGVISRDTEEAREVVASSKKNFPWQASVGISPERVEFVKSGTTTQVNGSDFNGPGYVIREAKLNEISFVDAGADDSTSASIAASQQSQTPEQLEQNMEPDENGTNQDQNQNQNQNLNLNQDAGNQQANQQRGSGGSSSMQLSIDEMTANAERESTRRSEIMEFSQEILNDHPELGETVGNLATQAIEASVNSSDFRFQAMQLAGTYPNLGGPRRDRNATQGVMEAGLCIAGGMDDAELSAEFDEDTLNMAEDRYHGTLMLSDVIDQFARNNGFTGHSIRANPEDALELAAMSQLRLSSASTVSLPNLLGAVGQRFAARGFNAIDSSIDMIAATRSVKDFKRITSHALTGDFTYKEINPNGELEHAKPSEVDYGNQVKTRGVQFALTRVDVINDDTSAFTSIPKKIGRGGALTKNEICWKAWLDGIAASYWVDAVRKNKLVGTASALGVAGMTAARTLFGKQTDDKGKPLGSMPKILLVPTALDVEADILLNSTEVRGTGSNFGVHNPHKGKVKKVVSPYLGAGSFHTGGLDTHWWLLADPSDLPSIEIAYLNNRKVPVIRSGKMPIGSLGIQFDAYFDFGAELQEYRGSNYNKGVA